MKKMIPVYVILFAILGTVGLVGYKALQKLDRMNATLIRIQMDQGQSNSGGVMEVEVVNTPSVTVTGSVEVDVKEPLSVEVSNEPLAVQIH